ncbi:putative membrane protein [SAR116 cluster alpha proteobacterium HIMB100]|nr:putative membrane protein [SAR116 cluster alpha proteobacterium HIMB100]
MSLLLAEAHPIPLHALTAMVAIILGGVQFYMKKGGAVHKLLGRAWGGLMGVVCVSSFFIHEIKLWGVYSPIHLLSIWTIVSLGLAIYFVRVGNIKRHKQVMLALYGFALILTGFFTFMPGRVMHQIAFG